MSLEEKMDFRSLTEMVQLARKNLAPGEGTTLLVLLIPRVAFVAIVLP